MELERAQAKNEAEHLRAEYTVPFSDLNAINHFLSVICENHIRFNVLVADIH